MAADVLKRFIVISARRRQLIDLQCDAPLSVQHVLAEIIRNGVLAVIAAHGGGGRHLHRIVRWKLDMRPVYFLDPRTHFYWLERSLWVSARDTAQPHTCYNT